MIENERLISCPYCIEHTTRGRLRRFEPLWPIRSRRPEGVGRLLLERGLVAMDPDAPGEVHGPLDYAPEPDSLARRLFDQPVIAAHLDHLAHGQRADGGWTFNCQAWSPAAELEWRGSVTVDALRVLRANGRLPATSTAAAGRA